MLREVEEERGAIKRGREEAIIFHYHKADEKRDFGQERREQRVLVKDMERGGWEREGRGKKEQNKDIQINEECKRQNQGSGETRKTL
jgi:hypothetical protein